MRFALPGLKLQYKSLFSFPSSSDFAILLSLWNSASSSSASVLSGSAALIPSPALMPPAYHTAFLDLNTTIPDIELEWSPTLLSRRMGTLAWGWSGVV